jgi:transcription initiation factor TFIID subunit 13
MPFPTKHPHSYIIETCHEAEAHARYSNRSKVKVDDFQFCLRHDSKKLGRVQELLDMDRELKNKRKAFNVDEGNIGKDVGAPGTEEKGAKKSRKGAGAGGGVEEGGMVSGVKKSKKVKAVQPVEDEDDE